MTDTKKLIERLERDKAEADRDCNMILAWAASHGEEPDLMLRAYQEEIREREAAEARVAELEARLIDVTASLVAAVSLLKRGGKAAKKAAASDKMFDQMVKDYEASIERARAALNKEPESAAKMGAGGEMVEAALRFDDGSEIAIASYSGGGSAEGMFGQLSLMKTLADGTTLFRRYHAIDDWLDVDNLTFTAGPTQGGGE